MMGGGKLGGMRSKGGDGELKWNHDFVPLTF